MVGLSTTMRRLGIITVTNSAVVTPTPISSTAAFSRNLTLRSPLRNHHLTNSIRLLKSRSLLSSFSCFSSSSSAAYLPALDEFPSTKASVAVRDDNKKVILKGMSYASLQEWVESHGFRPGQAMMLWKRLYKDNIWAENPDQLQGLNKDFKRMISEHAEFGALSFKDVRSASDGTRKILFTLDDGLVIETVVIPCDRGRTTVCVSSQVGCAMNCQFCYTGR
ncbi:hypothetical protein F2Q70_00001757 [Brassica cretica]|nr:hypothetical protein F2Q70_00001757 [Brassica cretica]